MMTRTRTHDPACSGEATSSVVPRSALSPAYCISLVPAAHSHQPQHHATSDPSPRACRQKLVVPGSGDLVYLPGGTAATSASAAPVGYTRRSSVTQEAVLVQQQPLNSLSAPGEAAPSNRPRAMSSEPPLLIPSESSVRSILGAVAPRTVLDGMCIIKGAPAAHASQLSLQRRYELKLPSTHNMYDMLVLVLAPPSMLRLLRSEQCIIRSEAVVVEWIREVLSGTVRIRRRAILGTKDDHTYFPRSIIEEEDGERCGGDFPTADLDLLTLLPSLIDHSQSANELGSAYNILSHLNGLSLSSLPKRLTTPERRHVDFQIGKIVRRLSALKSPSGNFGPAIAVLSPSTLLQNRAGGGMDNPGGMTRWSVAFQSMLEGVLRDAEDMVLTIPYQTIRRHFRRLGWHLDEVTTPRLVILDAAHDSNIMAERIDRECDGKWRSPRSTNSTMDDGTCEGPDGESDDIDGSDGYGEDESSIRVTGLRDWSNCIFGDPLMAMVFCEKPSPEFLRGFSGQVKGHKVHEYDGGRSFKEYEDDLIEQRERVNIRLLLYQCYHETVAVVKEFYRPQIDSTIREFAARKRLNAVLAKLESIDDDPKRSHSRAWPSGEVSPAKKSKTNEESGEEPS